MPHPWENAIPSLTNMRVACTSFYLRPTRQHTLFFYSHPHYIKHTHKYEPIIHKPCTHMSQP